MSEATTEEWKVDWDGVLAASTYKPLKPLGISEHFPPSIREELILASKEPNQTHRLRKIARAHEYAVRMYPELFKPGA